MWTFSIDTNPSVRTKAMRALEKSKFAAGQKQLSASQHRKALSKFGFVASPPGNGLDTHRTWEAMYLRCVPIVLRSEMTERYFQAGLPVWIVDSYDELINLDENFLKAKYEEFMDKFKSDSLWMNYWIELINGEKASN